MSTGTSLPPGGVGPRAFEVTRHHAGERLDRFLHAMVPRMSRASVQQALAEGRVELGSGVRPKAARRLCHGERVVLRPRAVVGPLPEPPVVLARGDGWQVVDKPAGLACLPSARAPGRDVKSLTGLSPAHRLDRHTSGCLLLVGTPRWARHFEAAFREGRVSKEYGAVVHGVVESPRWTCELSIAAARFSRVPQAVEARSDGSGRSARTDFVRLAACERTSLSLVEARPRTGRRHQVRVHLAASGHPIVGDLLHGGDERRFVRWKLGQPTGAPPLPPELAGLAPGRHLLHARRLSFVDPEGREVSVTAPWPADFPWHLRELAEPGR